VDLTALHTRLGTQVRRAYPGIQNLQVVQLPPLADPRTFIALFQQSGLVNYAELDFVVHALRTPDDFYFMNGALWGLHNTGQLGGRPDADNSIRLFHALNGLGKTTALYMYPLEDHGPATQETLLDLWARWGAWLDKYVKNPQKADPNKPAPAAGGGGGGGR
jgi:hypothetical protein